MKEWAAASETYREYLDKLLTAMRPDLKEFALIASSQFHDAEVVLNQEQTADSIIWSPLSPDDYQKDRRVRFFTICLRTNDSIANVNYILRRPLSHFKHREGVFTGSVKRFWLYDEVLIDPAWYETMRRIAVQPGEPAPRPDLIHCILFSDGLELNLPFSEVFHTSVLLSAVCEEVSRMADAES